MVVVVVAAAVQFFNLFFCRFFWYDASNYGKTNCPGNPKFQIFWIIYPIPIPRYGVRATNSSPTVHCYLLIPM
jgi:hypothetical protein